MKEIKVKINKHGVIRIDGNLPMSIIHLDRWGNPHSCVRCIADLLIAIYTLGVENKSIEIDIGNGCTLD